MADLALGRSASAKSLSSRNSTATVHKSSSVSSLADLAEVELSTALQQDLQMLVSAKARVALLDSTNSDGVFMFSEA